MVSLKRSYPIKVIILKAVSFQELCKLAQVRKLRTTPDRPQTKWSVQMIQWYSDLYAWDIGSPGQRALA